MKSLRPKRVVLFVVTLMIAKLSSVESRDPTLHRVGGGQHTWEPNTNFSDWSIHQHFYVGDWLYFGFNKQIYNVLEVNKTSYENCIEVDYITNITRGGRDVFNLTQVKDYYFICGRGFCSQGMKVEVSVQEIPPTDPPEISPQDDLQTNYGFSGHVTFVTVIATLACFLLLL